MNKSNEFNKEKEMEDLFLKYLYTDGETFVRVKNIISPAFFEDIDNRKSIEFLLKYTDKYGAMPTSHQAKAEVNLDFDVDTTTVTRDKADIKWFMDTFEVFCQQKAAKQAAYDSIELIEDGNMPEVLARMKKATELCIVKDLGIDFFDDPAAQLRDIRDNSKKISTGWKAIDKKLYGGIERGTLTIWLGQSGAGKSLFLQNQAMNWTEAGLNVLYITLELSEQATLLRMAAMTTNYSTIEVLKNIDDSALRVAALKKKCKGGTLRLKQLPNGSSANDIRALIKEYEIQEGIKVDAVLVDYLDLCSPLNKRVNPSDLFVKDKYVSEELRNIAVDLDILMISASQLNRGSHDEIEFGQQHVSGGISKIMTADNVLAIFTTISMRENGRYQIQFIKTRSSAGVGSKIDLKYNIRSLRIVDLEEGEEDAQTHTASNILKTLNRANIVTDVQETESEKARKAGSAAKQQAKALRDLIKRRNI